MKRSFKIAIAMVGAVLIAGTLPVMAGDETGAGRRSLSPVAYQSYADAYDFGAGPAHFLIGTADPNDGPPNGLCLGEATGCSFAAGDLTIGRAAYVGSILTGPPNGQQMVSVFAFPALEITDHSADKYSLKINNFQNFTGYAHRLDVKVLQNRGDNGSDFGAEDIFRDIGPFGVPTGGSAGAIISLMTDARSNPTGSTVVPSQGALTSHAWGPGPLDTYDTFDRSVVVDLGDIRPQILAAQKSGASYNSCRYSCLGASLDRNVDCDLPIVAPLYVAIVSTSAGNRSSSAAIQDGIAVDNILHLQGDCDFDGGQFPGDYSNVELMY